MCLFSVLFQCLFVYLIFSVQSVNIVNMIIVCLCLFDLVFVLFCHLIPYVSSMIILIGIIGNCFGDTWNEMTTMYIIALNMFSSFILCRLCEPIMFPLSKFRLCNFLDENYRGIIQARFGKSDKKLLICFWFYYLKVLLSLILLHVL